MARDTIILLGSKVDKAQWLKNLMEKPVFGAYIYHYSTSLPMLEDAAGNSLVFVDCCEIKGNRLFYEEVNGSPAVWNPRVDTALYFVDLEANQETIKQDIAAFQAIQPLCKIILVAANFDKHMSTFHNKMDAIFKSNPSLDGPFYAATTNPTLQHVQKSQNLQLLEALYEDCKPAVVMKKKDKYGLFSERYNPEVLTEYPSVNTPITPPIARAPVEGFLTRHRDELLCLVVIAASQGAIVGAGLGLGMGITGTIPTFGISLLASWLAVPIMAGGGAVVGGALGLVVGLAVLGYMQHQMEKKPTFFATEAKKVNDETDKGFFADCK